MADSAFTPIAPPLRRLVAPLACLGRSASTSSRSPPWARAPERSGAKRVAERIIRTSNPESRPALIGGRTSTRLRLSIPADKGRLRVADQGPIEVSLWSFLRRIAPPGAKLASIEATAEERHGLDAAQLLITASLREMPTLRTCSSGLDTARKAARRCPKEAGHHQTQKHRNPLHFDLDSTANLRPISPSRRDRSHRPTCTGTALLRPGSRGP
jgi:hypothetical protein